MKKAVVTVSYDAEKLSALKVYLGQRGTQVEDELARALDAIYHKTVPAGVREFFELREESTEAQKPKKAKPAFGEPPAAAAE